MYAPCNKCLQHPCRGLRATKEEGLRIQLAQQLLYLPNLIEGVAYARKALGEANRMRSRCAALAGQGDARDQRGARPRPRLPQGDSRRVGNPESLAERLGKVGTGRTPAPARA
jgi:hypothetical protein